LRFSPISWQSSEDLDPHFLRDISGDVVVAAKATYDRVDMRRVPQPKLPHRCFVAFHGALKSDLVGLHPVWKLVTPMPPRVAFQVRSSAARSQVEKHLH
jgi:hypothetical protein